jgi:hypothetical protein
MGHLPTRGIANGMSGQISPLKAHWALQHSPLCYVKFKLPVCSHINELKV